MATRTQKTTEKEQSPAPSKPRTKASAKISADVVPSSVLDMIATQKDSAVINAISAALDMPISGKSARDLLRKKFGKRDAGRTTNVETTTFLWEHYVAKKAAQVTASK